MPRSDWDVVVVGTGAGGLAAAVMAATGGARVLVLEKAERVGGTTRKAVGATWIPNNRFMRSDGVDDDPSSCLRYLARIGRPHRYDPEAPHLGLAAWEYQGLVDFIESAAQAHEHFERLGALGLRPADGVHAVDYLAHLPENRAPHGRTLYPARAAGAPTGGREMIEGFLKTLMHAGGTVELGIRVVGVLQESSRVAGVAAVGPDGVARDISARAVVFATGGFTHDAELRNRYLPGPLVGGCAAASNTGDFVRIAASMGADLATMNEAWMSPISPEMLAADPDALGTFFSLGDGVIYVNTDGVRVVNEKAPYNELARAMATWDPVEARYPNSPLIAIWDATNARRWGRFHQVGSPIRDVGDQAPWIVVGDTLDELAELVADRLGALRRVFGPVELSGNFSTNLGRTVAEFGDDADAGTDQQFRRGATPLERYVSNRFEDGDGPNPTMRRLDRHGPYFATVLGLGALDTKGGPRVDTHGRVLDASGGVLLGGLYAVGNCAASPTGQGYPAPGGTLGPIIASAYRAGLHMVRYQSDRT